MVKKVDTQKEKQSRLALPKSSSSIKKPKGYLIRAKLIRGLKCTLFRESPNITSHRFAMAKPRALPSQREMKKRLNKDPLRKVKQTICFKPTSAKRTKRMLRDIRCSASCAVHMQMLTQYAEMRAAKKPVAVTTQTKQDNASSSIPVVPMTPAHPTQPKSPSPTLSKDLDIRVRRRESSDESRRQRTEAIKLEAEKNKNEKIVQESDETAKENSSPNTPKSYIQKRWDALPKAGSIFASGGSPSRQVPPPGSYQILTQRAVATQLSQVIVPTASDAAQLAPVQSPLGKSRLTNQPHMLSLNIEVPGFINATFKVNELGVFNH